MYSSTTFCCVQCRLLQPPATSCAECGAPTCAPLELVRELLHYRDMNLRHQREWALATAFLAGSSLALPLLAPFAVGSLIALGVHRLRGARRKRTIAGISVPPAVAAPGAITLYGIARRFRATVASLIDDAPVLLEHAVIRDRRGAVLLRRTCAAPFLLEQGDRGPVLVTGVARVATPHMPARRLTVQRGDARLEKMGVPADLAISGELEVASVAPDGPALAVTGLVEDEAVAELAFHRDGGQIQVMRGKVGAPILVEDRRLIAAAL
ncbi:MAG TPA: hypothetical protein VNO30_14590 [Kofleriaceae bacterium]|nr:hypothetical protein [Kofleriaceae bacterium]